MNEKRARAEGFIIGKAVCNICKYEWLAAPEPNFKPTKEWAEGLECPNCASMNSRWIPENNDHEHPFWKEVDS